MALPIKNDNVNDNVNDKKNYQKILLLYCVKPRTRMEMFQKIGLKYHTDNYKKHIEPLLDNGLIKMMIPDKPRSRNQSYITTTKGMELIKQK